MPGGLFSLRLLGDAWWRARASCCRAAAEPDKGRVGTFSSKLPSRGCEPRELQPLVLPPLRVDLYALSHLMREIDWSMPCVGRVQHSAAAAAPPSPNLTREGWAPSAPNSVAIARQFVCTLLLLDCRD